jgi:hypothetical protein
MESRQKSAIGKVIRRLYSKNEPLNIAAVKRRHPELLQKVYAFRPFLGWRQALKDAGIDYRKINVELEEKCVCQICGAEAGILSLHLQADHQVTPAEYREEFPGAEIMAETVRAAKRTGKAVMPHWEPLWSLEYALDRLWEFHRRGWALNSEEVQRRERPIFSYVLNLGWAWDEVLQMLGLPPEQVRKQAVGQHLTKRDVLRGLRNRTREGKSVTYTAVEREDLRLCNAARRHFGSYEGALRAAGIDPKRVRLKTPRYTEKDIEKLGVEMQRVASLQGPERAKAASELKKRYRSLVYNRLGNWKKACRKFRVAESELAVHPYATKRHVIEGLRRWSLSCPGGGVKHVIREDRTLHTAIYRFFGSWAAATKAANVSFPRKRYGSTK